ncbi:MAG TPA: arsenical pump-driving ATPase [Candidatus Acidoferrales bacterium]|nr:arsenical pump-driving ATPase [Candidatus Acidoferrales bacterium]
MRDASDFLNQATRILFFTGKGGVGKTSLSCATAVTLARSGKRVLLVSTDPASNLDEVLGVQLSSEPRAVPGAVGLSALNIDPEAAAHAYRERVVGPYRGVLPEAAVTSMEEQLSGACTIEIAAFDEFTKLLGDKDATSEFDHIIFDTAPTGHTLRLLKLPAAWTGFIAENTSGTSCLGPLSGLQAQQALYESSLRTLSDPASTTLVLVSRPESSALAEADRTRTELAEIGLTNQYLFLNAVFVASDATDSGALALQHRGREAMNNMPERLAALPRLEIPLLPFAPVGISNLGRVFESDSPLTAHVDPVQVGATKLPGPLVSLIDEIEKMGWGVVMTMGKGGVGKTTIAAAVAVELAHRGHKVHLSTTDPAAHIAATVDAGVPGLQVSRIDPALETRRYTQEIMAKSAPQLDQQGQALLEEDLRSPCTEEIAVFRAFAETVAGGKQGFVVLDTAPTGHTLLLLDAAEAYHRDVLRSMSDMPDSVRNLLPRLRDPGFTKVLLVTLPEATPVHEAGKLQDDLVRAGITPFAWVINQSFVNNGFRDPVLVERGLRELPYIEEVRVRFASRLALVPWKVEAPVGPILLRDLIQTQVGCGR